MSPTKATGPRTESGKRTSSQNSFKHGLASGALLIPGEDPAEFAALQDALLAQYQPANVTEELLVADMAKAHWLKDRAIRLQGEALAVAPLGELPPTFPVLLRYQTTNERAFHKALSSLQAKQKERITQEQEFVSQQEQLELLSKIYAPLPDISKLYEKVEQRKREREHASVSPDFRASSTSNG